MTMLIIDIETTGLSLLNHRITVIGIIPYDTTTKTIVRDEVFNVINNEIAKNHDGIIEIKKNVSKILSESSSIVAFNGIKFDMPFIIPWLKGSPCVEEVPMYSTWDAKYLDFCAISTESTKRFISLSNICTLNNINVCKSRNGAQAVVCAKERNWKALCEYCLQDVYVLLELTQHAFIHGLHFSKTRIIDHVMPSETILISYDDKFQPVLAFDKLLMSSKPEVLVTNVCLADIFV